MTEKARWPNQTVFILAAVGSAAGLGNLWRFPYLAYEHGGAAFVLVLLLANLLVGLPILILELSLGQKMQKGTADAMGKVHPKWKFIGWWALLGPFLVLSYYAVVMGWGLRYLKAAFSLEWGADTQDFFFNKVLQVSEGAHVMGGFSYPVLIATVIAWVLIFLCLRKGIKSVSKVVVWTASLPFLLLAILIIRAVTLPGSGDGLSLLFIPDWSALLNSELWLAAFSQVFFSLSVATGIMISYGSRQPEKADITKAAVWVMVGNFVVSLMAGIVIFGTLGYMAHTQGVSVSDVFAGGPGLAFVVFPQAISMLPAFAAFFGVLFFTAVVMLAIDSAFSIAEGYNIAIKDRFPKIPTAKIAIVTTLLCFAVGLVFTTKGGLYYLDIVDHFVVNYSIVIIGILEAILIGYLFKAVTMRKWINTLSDFKLGAWWDFSIKIITPLFLAILLGMNIYREVLTPYEGYPLWALIGIGVIPVVLFPFIGLLLDKLMKTKGE